MKKQMIAGLALCLVASSAGAAVVTPGSDFDAVDGEIAGLEKTVIGVINSGSSQVTALGGLKRQPSSAPDGSQTVTIQAWRPNTTQLVNGVVWASNSEFLNMKSFMTNASDGQNLTKTLTFPSTMLTNTSNLIGIIYMAPSVQLLSMTTN
jgi:hypothetical protein